MHQGRLQSFIFTKDKFFPSKKNLNLLERRYLKRSNRPLYELKMKQQVSDYKGIFGIDVFRSLLIRGLSGDVWLLPYIFNVRHI